MYLCMYLYRLNMKPLGSLQHMTHSQSLSWLNHTSLAVMGPFKFYMCLPWTVKYCMYLFFRSAISLTYVPQYEEGVCNFVQLKQLKSLWKSFLHVCCCLWCTLWADQQRAVTSVISDWFPVYFELLNRPEFKMLLLSVR